VPGFYVSGREEAVGVRRCGGDRRTQSWGPRPFTSEEVRVSRGLLLVTRCASLDRIRRAHADSRLIRLCFTMAASGTLQAPYERRWRQSLCRASRSPGCVRRQARRSPSWAGARTTASCSRRSEPQTLTV